MTSPITLLFHSSFHSLSPPCEPLQRTTLRTLLCYMAITPATDPPYLFYQEFAIHTEFSAGFLGESSGPMKLRDIIGRLQQIYTGTVGLEYMHIWNGEQVNWLREQARML